MKLYALLMYDNNHDMQYINYNLDDFYFIINQLKDNSIDSYHKLNTTIKLPDNNIEIVVHCNNYYIVVTDNDYPIYIAYNLLKTLVTADLSNEKKDALFMSHKISKKY